MEEGNDPKKDIENQLLLSQPVEHHHGGSSARQMMQTAKLFIHPVQMFTAGSPSFSRVSSSKSSPEQDENARKEDIEKGIVQCGNSDQTAPLLEKVDYTWLSRKPVRRLMYVIHSIVAFKASIAICAPAHPGDSSVPEGKLEVATVSDSLATSSEQNIKNISIIVCQKNLPALVEFGGLDGVKDALRTNLVEGISEGEALIRRQQRVFSTSLATTHTLFHFLWEAIKQKRILLLLVGTVLSIVFEIKQEGLKYGCSYGADLLVAIVILVFFASIREYWQEHKEQKKLKNHQCVERGMGRFQVTRGGDPKVICESELVRGDILLLKKGDEVPCDGLFIGGEPLELDYGSESCIVNEHNPFLSYGERVINGECQMLVTSTNMETGWSEMMNKISPNAKFKLEIQLHKLNTRMDEIQIFISVVIIVVLVFRNLAGHINDENDYRPESTAEPHGMEIFAATFKKIIKEYKYTTKVLTRLLCVSLVGLTEGVPFVVSLAIVYWNNKALFGKASEQDLHAVTKMAHVTRICTDTFFTEDGMEVENVFIGGKFMISKLAMLSPDVIEVLRDGISMLNHKSFSGVKDMFGSKREKIWKVIATKGAKLFEEPCGVLMRGIEESEKLVWHFNGPMEEILNMCKYYYDIEGHTTPLDDKMKQRFVQANQEKQPKYKWSTIALACKPTLAKTQDVDDLILIALLDLKIKNNEDINAQVRALRDRGIKIVIVSSKKLSVVQEIARKCNVTNDDSLMITREEFRNYTDKERFEEVDKISGLGEALPSDKLLLIDAMREKGEVVAFLGQRTDEAPALKRAHIGIAMGTCSFEKAIKNCDIIMDGNFGDLINIVDSGKCIYYNIQSFLQIVLNMAVSSTLIGLIETTAFGETSLTLFQLVFVNLAVDILGGLALLTKASTDKLVSAVPISCEQSLITAEMSRNILFQVSYQAIYSVILRLKGSAVVDPNLDSKTVVSNMFIICQIFNLFNARELRKKNFFRDIHEHKEFWAAVVMFIALHATFVMVQDGTRLEWKLWVVYVVLGVVSWLVDWLGKCISIAWFIAWFNSKTS